MATAAQKASTCSGNRRNRSPSSAALSGVGNTSGSGGAGAVMVLIALAEQSPYRLLGLCDGTKPGRSGYFRATTTTAPGTVRRTIGFSDVSPAFCCHDEISSSDH